MTRPFKTGVDYFPLDVSMDDEIELIESEHGIAGFGVLIKIYQKIYACNYWIKWDKKACIVFSKRVNVDINSINAIINSCIEWEIFNEKLFKKYQILTSKGIQKRFFEIIKRRKKIEVIKDYLLIDPLVYVDINSINVRESTQSKGKDIKIKNNTYSDEFEKCWSIVPKRNGAKEGKKPASDKFEKLSLEDKRRCYFGLENYSEHCRKTDKLPKDFVTFINQRIFEDYQKKIILPKNTDKSEQTRPIRNTVID